MAEVAGTSSTSTSSSSQVASTSLMGNYELFLSLLTTQIQNQDPLDPLDSAEYTNQLVQYSAVEQSIQTNAYLENMVAAMESSQASSYVSYLGAQVSASGNTTMLEDGSAAWSYSLSEGANGTVEVRNSAGAVVYSSDITLEKGGGTFTWDGVSDSGGSSPEGAYTVSFDVKDASGNAEPVATEISGVVDEVDLSSGAAFLKIGDIKIPVSAVQNVSRSG
ncbi:flagellar hook assembly protein FlgD [Roseibium sp.]|uniref:flagellar hook assembly protein FlgD n=1 Tax=Roseibium sp. TaxID=1936156 RepID=UPI003A96E296